MRFLAVYGIIWLLLMIAAIGCNLFKTVSAGSTKDHELNKHESSLTLNTELEESRQLGLLSIYKDSNNREYSVELWPRGVFKFSPDSGFEGEADKVLLKGNVSQVKNAAIVIKNSERENMKQSEEYQQVDEKVKEREQQVKTSSPSWKWMLLVLLVLLGLGLWLYRKFKLH